MMNQNPTMETHMQMPMVAFPRKLWNALRVFFLTLGKGVCKKKLLFNLNLLLKRTKLAGSRRSATGLFGLIAASKAVRQGEYEFSCSTTPAHHKFLVGHVIPALHVGKRRRGKGGAHFDSIEEEMAAISDTLEMMARNDVVGASPALTGFGRSPVVWGLRVTDSPFPVQLGGDDMDCHVDRAADEFIKRFYRHLRMQSLTDG